MTPDQIAELKRIAKKAEPLLANCEGHLNHPLRNRDGKRVVGFVLPEDIAGLSDGLFMVEAVQQLAEAVPALIARIEALEAESRDLTKALTGLTCGGSEFFIRKGERYVADIKACVEWVQRRDRVAHDRIMKVTAERDEAKTRAALNPESKP